MAQNKALKIRVENRCERILSSFTAFLLFEKKNSKRIGKNVTIEKREKQR